MRFLPVRSMVAAGICVSIQGPINAGLRLALGSPVYSAAISFFPVL
ncbi:MAG: DMT family transporter [Verrucomicrobia bacterium]|nr:DMT family transporter [Verrucomicrobiota bacterium]